MSMSGGQNTTNLLQGQDKYGMNMPADQMIMRNSPNPGFTTVGAPQQVSALGRGVDYSGVGNMSPAMRAINQAGFSGGDPVQSFAYNQMAQAGSGQALGDLYNLASNPVNTNVNTALISQMSNPGIMGITDPNNPYLSTYSDLMKGGINPFLEGMVNSAGDVVGREFSRSIIPALHSRGNAANPYGGGGTREQIAQGIAASDAQQQLADFSTNLYGQAYDQDQARRLAAGQAYNTALETAAQRGAQGAIARTNAENVANQNAIAARGQQIQALLGGTGQQLQAAQALGSLRGSDLNRALQSAQVAGQLGLSSDQLALQANQANAANQLQALSTIGNLQNQAGRLALDTSNAGIQNQLAAQNQASTSQNALLNTLLAGAQGATNLGLSPYSQMWNQLMNYAQVVNNPAIVSTGHGSESNFGFL